MVDHGSSTLVDSLLSYALSPVLAATRRTGDRDYLAQWAEERKNFSSARMLCHKSKLLEPFPGHPDELSQQINVAYLPLSLPLNKDSISTLALSDGVIIVADVVEFFPAYSLDSVLREIVRLRLRPILFINKLDRAFLELLLPMDELENSITRIIDHLQDELNRLIDLEPSMTPEIRSRFKLSPLDGTVVFGSGIHGWAFSIPQTAAHMAQRDGSRPDSIQRRLWGPHYWAREDKKWLQNSDAGPGKPPLPTGFQQLLNMFRVVYEGAINGDRSEVISKFCTSYGIRPQDVSEFQGKVLAKEILRRAHQVSFALLDSVGRHIPAPVEAQQFRFSTLQSPLSRALYSDHIRSCNPRGPLIVCVTTSSVNPRHGRPILIGRVLSGILTEGLLCQVLSRPDYYSDQPFQLKPLRAKIMDLRALADDGLDSFSALPCGNLAGFTLNLDLETMKRLTFPLTVVDPSLTPVPLLKALHPNHPMSPPRSYTLAVAPEDPLQSPEVDRVLRALLGEVQLPVRPLPDLFFFLILPQSKGSTRLVSCSTPQEVVNLDRSLSESLATIPHHSYLDLIEPPSTTSGQWQTITASISFGTHHVNFSLSCKRLPPSFLHLLELGLIQLPPSEKSLDLLLRRHDLPQGLHETITITDLTNLPCGFNAMAVSSDHASSGSSSSTSSHSISSSAPSTASSGWRPSSRASRHFLDLFGAELHDLQTSIHGCLFTVSAISSSFAPDDFYNFFPAYYKDSKAAVSTALQRAFAVSKPLRLELVDLWLLTVPTDCHSAVTELVRHHQGQLMEEAEPSLRQAISEEFPTESGDKKCGLIGFFLPTAQLLGLTRELRFAFPGRTELIDSGVRMLLPRPPPHDIKGQQ